MQVGTEWSPDEQTLLRYDAQGHLVESLRRYRDWGSKRFKMVEGERSLFAYDAADRLIEEERQVWWRNKWLKTVRLLRTYEETPEARRAAAASLSGDPSTPAGLVLGPNYPNPFNPETVLPFTLPEAAEVVVRVYDMLGREIAVLARGVHEAGRHEVRWQAEGLPTGLYVVRMEAGGQAFTQTVTLLK